MKLNRITKLIITTVLVCLSVFVVFIYLIFGMLFVFGDENPNINTSRSCQIDINSNANCEIIKRGWPLIFQQGYGRAPFVPTAGFNYIYFIIDLAIFISIPSILLYFSFKPLKKKGLIL